MKPDGKGDLGRWRSAAAGRQSGSEGSRSWLGCRGKRVSRRSLVCAVGGRKAGVLRERYTEDGDWTAAAESMRAAVRAGQVGAKSVAAGRVCSHGWDDQRARAPPLASWVMRRRRVAMREERAVLGGGGARRRRGKA